MQTKFIYCSLFAWLGIFTFTNACSTEYEKQRQHMVEEVEQMMTDTSLYTNMDKLSEPVRHAMSNVLRHKFVPEAVLMFAYQNRPLPIGNDQTISQPYIVALMTELAAVDEYSVVLEVGTGSGYQAAVLAEIVDHVYSIEIIETLGLKAKAILKQLGYNNVTIKVGDGYRGWPEYAPFDAILVTAAPVTVPQPLIEQLKVGGHMVIPVGKAGKTQSLKVIRKQEDGSVEEKEVLPVAFVPLTRDEKN